MQAEIALWEQITRIREQAGITPDTLAQTLGITQTAATKLERLGYEHYTIAQLRTLATTTHHHLIIRFEPYHTEPATIIQRVDK